jgi:hypothetical protein
MNAINANVTLKIIGFGIRSADMGARIVTNRETTLVTEKVVASTLTGVKFSVM